MNAYLKRQPWFILAGHFVRRYFDTEAESGELRTGIPALLGFAAAPGLIACALLFEKYSTLKGWFLGVYTLDRDVTTLPDKYIFLTLAFAISGLATVFKWDSLFPDRQDYMILAPLPLRPIAIFASKFGALIVFVLVFSVAVNLAGAIFFPPVVLGNTGAFSLLLRYLASHLIGTMAASVAGAVIVIATAGLLLNILPTAMVRRASSWLQFAFLVLFTTQLFLAPQVAYKLMSFYEGPAWRSLLFPPMWFVGLYEHVLGRSSVDLSEWASWSRRVLVIGSGLACVFYISSYFRHFIRTGETAEAGVAPGGRVWRLLPRPQDPQEAAVVDFVKQTISRSAVHRVILRVFLGLACAVILQELLAQYVVGLPVARGAVPMAFSGPLVVSFFLLVGLRWLLEIPVNRPAAWAFHVALDDAATQPVLRAVRWVMLELGVVAWLVVTAPVNVLLLGWTMGIAHSTFCLIVSLLFLDGLLFAFRKVPFTCGMSSDRTYLGLAFAAWCSMFFVYSYVVTSIETALARSALSFVLSLLALLAAWGYLLSRKREWATLNTRLDLAGGTAPVVLTLDLQPK